MDKYEYKVRSEEISKLIDKERYADAVKIADTIDWRRVKSASMLLKIAALYRISRRNEDSREMLMLAYERYPTNRSVVYSLCELSIELDDVVAAIEYYKRFAKLAPKDNGVYTLRYRILEAQEASLEERIEILEELKKKDYQEEWAYELAYLYHRVGLSTKCVEECDDIILWFGDGPYVMKAMELKAKHVPLSEMQQQKYGIMLGNAGQNYTSAGYDTDGYAGEDYAGQDYTSAGYDTDGYAGEDYAGQDYNTEGYPEQNYQAEGYSEQGYGGQNYDAESYNGQNYDAESYDGQNYGAESYDGQNYGAESYDGQDYGAQNYNGQDYGAESYNGQSYGAENYNGQSYNEQNYNEGNYDTQGYDAVDYSGQGYDAANEYYENGYSEGAYGDGNDQEGYADASYENDYRQENYADGQYGDSYSQQDYPRDQYGDDSYAQNHLVDDGYGNLSYVDGSYQDSGYTEEFYVEQTYDEDGNLIDPGAYTGSDYMQGGYDDLQGQGYDHMEQADASRQDRNGLHLVENNVSSAANSGDMSQYNTINLQKVVAESMKELFPDDNDDVFAEDREKYNSGQEIRSVIEDTRIFTGVGKSDAGRSRSVSNAFASDNLAGSQTQTGKVNIAQMVTGVTEKAPEPHTGAIKKVLVPGEDARSIKSDSDIEELRDTTEKSVDDEHNRMEYNDENVYHEHSITGANDMEDTPQTAEPMKLDKVLVEWERMKQDNAKKHQEEFKKRVLTQTGKIFADFDHSIKSGILGELEREEEEAQRKNQTSTGKKGTDGFLDADVTGDIPQPPTSDDDFDVAYVTDQIPVKKIQQTIQARGSAGNVQIAPSRKTELAGMEQYPAEPEQVEPQEPGSSMQELYAEINEGDVTGGSAQDIAEENISGHESGDESAKMDQEESEAEQYAAKTPIDADQEVEEHDKAEVYTQKISIENMAGHDTENVSDTEDFVEVPKEYPEEMYEEEPEEYLEEVSEAYTGETHEDGSEAYPGEMYEEGPEEYPGETYEGEPEEHSGETYEEEPEEYPGETYEGEPEEHSGETYEEEPEEYPGETYEEEPEEYSGETHEEEPEEYTQEIYERKPKTYEEKSEEYTQEIFAEGIDTSYPDDDEYHEEYTQEIFAEGIDASYPDDDEYHDGYAGEYTDESYIEDSYTEESDDDLEDAYRDTPQEPRHTDHRQSYEYNASALDPEDAESIAEMAKEDALKTQEIKMNTADLSSLSEKIVATTKKEASGAKREEIRDFTPEEQTLFENFAVTRKIKKQIIHALENMTIAAYTGNVIITGDAGIDTVRMAKNLIKEYQASDEGFSGKLAKITGEKINQRNIKDVFEKLNNGGIIIEKANGMSEEKLYELATNLNQDTLGIVVIMEDTKKEITKLLEKQAMIVDYFNIRIDLMEMDNNALVAYAKNYALALEYSIDELGTLALYTRIANMQSGNHVVTKDEVRDIIDEAIWKSKKSKIKNFVDVLFARRYDNEDMIVLKERDFM